MLYGYTYKVLSSKCYVSTYSLSICRHQLVYTLLGYGLGSKWPPVVPQQGWALSLFYAYLSVKCCRHISCWSGNGHPSHAAWSLGDERYNQQAHSACLWTLGEEAGRTFSN